mmetsp:Transcript_36672/g.88360  ORF Transcript_36672/g.88360 Transcript_36672/m.88360 type:complete len:218 (-) Transcript_36672:274-927(-)
MMIGSRDNERGFKATRGEESKWHSRSCFVTKFACCSASDRRSSFDTRKGASENSSLSGFVCHGLLSSSGDGPSACETMVALLLHLRPPVKFFSRTLAHTALQRSVSNTAVLQSKCGMTSSSLNRNVCPRNRIDTPSHRKKKDGGCHALAQSRTASPFVSRIVLEKPQSPVGPDLMSTMTTNRARANTMQTSRLFLPRNGMSFSHNFAHPIPMMGTLA